MRTLRIVTAAAILASLGACHSEPSNTNTNPNLPADGGDNGSDVVANGDAAQSFGAGTCQDPYNLDVAGMRSGDAIMFEGSTSGLQNNLHPYGAADTMDAEEAVIEFRVTSDLANVQITTEGSEFDTLLYVRQACSQVMGGADIAFSDDTQRAGSTMVETFSTVFLTGLSAGEVLFIVVDGKAGTMGASNGRFRLSISPFTPGAAGFPCATDAMGVGTCTTAGQRCSAANLCVPSVAAGAACDPTGFMNACAANTTCVTDPSPPDGMNANAVCAAAGTHAGAPCRTTGTACDSPLVCNDQMDAAMCVNVVAAGGACDPMGISNRCATGLHCRTVSGLSFCDTGT